MRLLERVLAYACRVVKERCASELSVLKYKFEVPEVPFKRLTYDQVLGDLRNQGVDVPWGEDIPIEASRELGKVYPYFYFITDWPIHAKAFYIKPRDENPRVCEGFDLMWRHIELVSGGTRISHKKQLIERLKEKGLNPESFKYHLQAFDYDMPPHAGWAIALER